MGSWFSFTLKFKNNQSHIKRQEFPKEFPKEIVPFPSSSMTAKYSSFPLCTTENQLLYLLKKKKIKKKKKKKTQIFPEWNLYVMFSWASGILKSEYHWPPGTSIFQTTYILLKDTFHLLLGSLPDFLNFFLLVWNHISAPLHITPCEFLLPCLCRWWEKWVEKKGKARGKREGKNHSVELSLQQGKSINSSFQGGKYPRGPLCSHRLIRDRGRAGWLEDTEHILNVERGRNPPGLMVVEKEQGMATAGPFSIPLLPFIRVKGCPNTC